MNTCINCRYCKITSFPNISACEMYCKYHKPDVDYVTGQVSYKHCRSIRYNREVCPNWEQGGIKGFFQRLFKKLNLN